MATAADEVPAPFAPFEYLVGGWKGQGIPQANRLRGWPETHRWAWKFAKGTPVGLAVTLEGDKTLKQGALSYDEASRSYRLEGTDADGKAVAYAGSLDPAGKVLTLNRVGTSPSPGGKERLTLRPNSEKIRYTLVLDRQEPGAPQYSKVIEVGLTREGEAFAAGGASANLPKCIITGGAATMTVSYQGRSYDVCCTGCRDEFNDNPEKYVKKALARAQAGGGSPPASSAPTSDAAPAAASTSASEPSPKVSSKAKSTPRPKSESASAPKSSDPTAKAASLLRLGQALEKAGKTSGALDYYRQVVKDYPDSTQAKTAADRIKALKQ
jgi:YHS domain-containing protein